MENNQEQKAPDATVSKSAVARTHKACERAYDKCADHKLHLDDLYENVLPYRAPAGSRAAQPGSRNNRIFDSTATKAAFRFAGRMQQDVTPAFQQFFTLKAGPWLMAGPDEIKGLNENLDVISKKIGGILEGAQFATAAGEMYLDLFAGTGAMLMLEDEHDICRFVSVPVGEIALAEDGNGRVTKIYWKKEYEAEDVLTLWPESKMKVSDRLKKLAEDNPDTPCTISQACEWNRKTRQWHFTAYEPDHHTTDGAIYTTHDNACPWLSPRFYKVPGEAMGRGPGLVGLPTAKTLNKVTELTIKAAAFAILGLWTYRNDSKFNPKTAVMKPGAMWQVGATGGAMGASVQRLEVPGRFDVSNLILAELRASLKEVMLDDSLPDATGSVKSPTEIVEKLKRYAADLAGAYSRLILEIIKPLVQRQIELLVRRNLIEPMMPIDQLLLKVEVSSPIAKMQQAQDVQSLVQYMEIVLGTGGKEMLFMSTKIEDIFAEIGLKLGVPEKFIRSDTDRKKIQEMVAQLIANAQMAAQGETAQEATAQPQTA